MPPLQPNLPPWITADLTRHACDCVADDEPTHGTPLAEALEGTGWSWLEAAVLAGHAPHFEGVLLAIRALHAMWTEEIADSYADGADGDALGWTQQADQYREAIVILEGFVVEMELRAAALSAQPSICAPPLRKTHLEDAAAARGRADRATRRMEGAAADNHAAAALRERYPQADEGGARGPAA